MNQRTHRFAQLATSVLLSSLFPLAAQTTVSSSPGAPIPDNDAAGVSDVITVTDTGDVTDINVAVNVTHTWLSDLTVDLTHVGTGTTVRLFANACDANDDIDVTFDDEACAPLTCASPTTGTASPTGALADFDGESIAGDWRLDVVDDTAGDVGTLVSWSLTYETVTFTTMSSSPGVVIPDDDATGIVDSLSVTDTGPISGVCISVQITHQFINDLVIEVTHGAKTVPLYATSCTSGDNIDVTFADAACPLTCPPVASGQPLAGTYQPVGSLSAFDGQELSGTWTIRVADVSSLIAGTLDSWSVQYVAATPPQPVECICWMLYGRQAISVSIHGDTILVGRLRAIWSADAGVVFPVPIPSHPWLTGADLYFQAIATDPLVFPEDPFKTSNGIHAVVGGAATPYGPSSGLVLQALNQAQLGQDFELRFDVE